MQNVGLALLVAQIYWLATPRAYRAGEGLAAYMERRQSARPAAPAGKPQTGEGPSIDGN